MLLLCSRCKAHKEEEEFYKCNGRYKNRNGRAHLCKLCKREVTTEYTNKDIERWRKYQSERRRKHKYYWPYGLFDKVLEKQGNACAICGLKRSDTHIEFHADHNHRTKTPRGVLCQKCNMGLGCFDDNPESLKAAIKYLKKYSEAK